MKARCLELRDDLTTLGVPVTPQELDDYWPGGAENQLPGLGGWTYCWGMYTQFLGRNRPDQADKEQEAADVAALQAFRDHPVVVELVRPLPGLCAYLTVHPKSFDTLALLDEIEEETRWLTERLAWLQHRWEHEAPEKAGAVIRLLTEFELMAVWICVSEGPGVFFNPAETWPDIPGWLRKLEPLDILAVMRAHHTVNRDRIALIAKTLRKRDGEARTASWATLAMRAADALKSPADHLLKARSFASWFAEVAMRWDDQAESADRAAVKNTSANPLAGAIG